MIIPLSMTVGAILFFAGFFTGLINPCRKASKPAFDRLGARQTSKVIKEYKSFLNYDGSNQRVKE